MSVHYVGVHEAKTNLSAILRQIAKGEVFAITNRGKVVGELKAPQDTTLQKKRDAYREWLKMSKTSTIHATMEEVLAWRDEGRKYWWISFYDAAYLELALRENADYLFTFDKALMKAATAENLSVRLWLLSAPNQDWDFQSVLGTVS